MSEEMVSELSLSDVFNGMDGESNAVTEEKPPVQTAIPTGEPTATPPVAKTETPAPTTPTESESEAGMKAALTAERKHRQDLQARLEALELKAAPITAPPVKPPAPTIDEDPLGYLESETARVREEMAAVRREMAQSQQNIWEREVAGQYEAITRTHPDVGAMITEFGNAAKENPALLQQVSNARNPVEAAYKIAKNIVDARTYGGIEQTVAARIAETTAKMEAAHKAEIEALRLSSLPKSNATKRSDRGAEVHDDPDVNPFKKNY